MTTISSTDSMIKAKKTTFMMSLLLKREEGKKIKIKIKIKMKTPMRKVRSVERKEKKSSLYSLASKCSMGRKSSTVGR